MKQCRWCKVDKEDIEFGKRPSNSDGLYSWCRQCVSMKQKNKPEEQKARNREKQKLKRRKNPEENRARAKKWYYENRERALNNVKKYRALNSEEIYTKEAIKRIEDADRFEKNRAKHLVWRENNRERLNLYSKEWYQKNKEKRRANVVLNRAVKSGEMTRPAQCFECFKECKPDGHHTDYTKPLKVVWLCRACHSRKSPRTRLIKEVTY